MLIKSIISQKRGSRDFWQIANNVLNKGKSAIPPLFNHPEVLSSASDKAKLFAQNFSKNSNLDASLIPMVFRACAVAIVHRNHFFCLHQKDKSSESKVKFGQASNRCKRVLEAAKLAYANKVHHFPETWLSGLLANCQ